VGGGRPRQPDDQGSGDAGGHPCDPPVDCGWHNVNVTLLFAQEADERAAEAYIGGLEALVARGGDPSSVASVASFFVSRIDTAIDAAVDARLTNTAELRQCQVLRIASGQSGDCQCEAGLPALPGAVQQRAVACAGRARRADAAAPLGEHRHEERQLPRRTVRRGADWPRHRQHDAAADDGGVQGSRPFSRERLVEDLEGAYDTMRTLAEAGISLKETTDALLAEGIQLFSDAFRKLLDAVAQQSRGTGAEWIHRRFAASLPAEFEAAVQQSLAEWQTQGNVRRL
jgi:transaldolase / glucose-6-phosphate isomerase